MMRIFFMVLLFIGLYALAVYGSFYMRYLELQLIDWLFG